MKRDTINRHTKNEMNNQHLPRICFMSYYKLMQFSQPVIHEYAPYAHIESIDASFHQALKLAQERIEQDAVDVFVSAGSNASILKQHLQVPVINIDVSGFDILNALLEAKTHGTRVGIISYQNALPSLKAYSELLNLDLIEHTYTNAEDALVCIQNLKARSIDVIIGSSLIVDLATQLGIKSILSYSLDSIRTAFDRALEVFRIKNLESNRFLQLHQILQTLPEAVVAVDHFDKITAINHKMRDILSPKHSQPMSLIGKTLSELEPSITLLPQLLNPDTQLSKAIQLHNKSWVGVSSTITEDGITVGATLTLYDADTILKADEKLRILERTKQTYAKYTFDDIESQDPNFIHMIDRAKKYSQTDLDILITGETGTGKEMFAQAIHHASTRANHPFIAINCAAFPESLIESELFGYEDGTFTGAKKGGRRGLIEAAHKGTLFLDEIGDMPLQLQTRLLRVLQEREVTRLGSNVAIPIDIRVITATHQNLNLLIDEKKFRSDLYYRMNSLEIHLPPLRNRKQDIIDFLKNQIIQHPESSQDIHLLIEQLTPYFLNYSWQGNFRELNTVIQRIQLILSENTQPTLDDIAREIPHIFTQDAKNPSTLSYSEQNPSHHQKLNSLDMMQSKKAHALKAIALSNGKHTKAAKLLGISRTTLWRWLNSDPNF